MAGPVDLVLRTIGARTLGTITSVRTEEPVVALTFDDGPDPDTTPRLLDMLRAHGAAATFFMIGVQATQYPDLVRRVHNEGHSIGNHTWSHPVLPALTSSRRRAEIRKGSAALADLVGNGERLFRPPHGAQTIGSRLDAAILRQKVIAWSVYGEDWRGYTSAKLVEILLAGIRPGSIVLLHDRLCGPRSPEAGDRKPTLQAVEIILGRLADQYRFVTVPKLLEIGRPVKKNWYRLPKRRP